MSTRKATVKATAEEVVNTEAANSEATESRADKFKRLATKRVNKILKYIELTKNLANKSAYDYTPEQVETIISSITSQTEALKATFSNVEKETPSITL